ncbi:tetratricopeptide repeat protein [Amycolatopsis sp. 195334CR]|uniref:tetratricopeptide repeat protein n=1 Tax=Amycolatopsis sp. 195334CR TaxID=2814588 RepID=UPI001A8F8D20|nr:tetratricopeptide repeat protein [Amycolatopsis sp. 195334CR]MBN6038232.1 tetratricopeptide repeat protein [Amycolatopsis sp. 195334CR]
MAQYGKWDRRSLLRGAAALAGAAAAVPLLGGVAAAQAEPAGDADALFKAGHFDQAARAYENILKTDPKNLNAARQRGYVALLSNKFPDAEKYLTMALDLSPGDKDTNYLLADCYLRQDKFALSVPRWQATGEESYAKWFGAVTGEPYQLHGDSARLPFQQMDPMPLVEASVNGGPPKRFSFYTGAPNLGVSASVAKEAGLTPVTSQKVEYENGVIWAHYGILDSLKLGGLELRNLPVGWSTTESGEDTDSDSDGLIGTWVLYHLRPTFDYAGRSLILRRPAPEPAAGGLPLWLAREQYLHSRGSFAGSGPRVVGVNIGGTGEVTAGMFGETAKQLGIRTDHDREIGTFGSSHPAVVYPCYPKEIRLGDAVAKEAYCYTNPNRPINVPLPFGTGFDTMGWFAHCFWKPYHVTLDFTAMSLHIARGPAAG